MSFSSTQQLYKNRTLQYWNPSACALCYSLNAGPQSQCFGSVLREWTTCFHRGGLPSIPAHRTGRILKDSRTIRRYITTHSCTLTHTHTQTQRQIHARVAGASRRLTSEGGATAGKQNQVWKMSVKAVSCSRTETAGHRCCCWAGRGGPDRTAARLGWSAQGEAWRRRTTEGAIKIHAAINNRKFQQKFQLSWNRQELFLHCKTTKHALKESHSLRWQVSCNS